MDRLAAILKLPAGKKAHMRQMGAQTIDIPMAYELTFSVEDHGAKGLARHMSMSVTRLGRLPTPEALWMVAEHLGYTGGLDHCMVWIEDLHRTGGVAKAPNVLQFVSTSQGGTA